MQLLLFYIAWFVVFVLFELPACLDSAFDEESSRYRELKFFGRSDAVRIRTLSIYCHFHARWWHPHYSNFYAPNIRYFRGYKLPNIYGHARNLVLQIFYFEICKVSLDFQRLHFSFTLFANRTLKFVFAKWTSKFVFENRTLKFVFKNWTLKFVFDNWNLKFVSAKWTSKFVFGNWTLKYVFAN